ncbi:hypothetical protein DCAR_0103694 [Daucus carota subsp. sativus]|uniref:Uncharacterized protein n=1 Tax=Daucus carota subsp. sativus TaxID=79200 RepID=A0A166I7N1_DAUCS|nr:PREDICTED: protein SENSITIVE TO PROTON RHIZOTOXICITY 1-like [Daucus carota subsp. sativus]WOG84510.1 hypothetical protein DCAR_0103694 [Daucus carota subsp. sativus]
MSSSGDLRHFPANTITSSSLLTADPSIPLLNLAAVQTRIDAVRTILSNSLQTQTLIGKVQLQSISDEITGSIQQIVVNGTALISSSIPPTSPARPDPTLMFLDPELQSRSDIKPDIKLDTVSDDWETIELGSEELLAEFAHFCDVCGKGFKRDANLRMHMRAHGNEFKTLEALAKPEKGLNFGVKKIRFSCPMIGCNRNKCHDKFKALKTVVCVKNHFKRSHCPKSYVCSRCNKKSFSVMSDLRNHLKHCGEVKWKCTCGTSFSRKDKLFGHMALFEGHMPAIMEDEEKGKEVVEEKDSGVNVSENRKFEGLIGEYGSIEEFCLDDMLNTSNDCSLVTQMDGFFDF